MSPYAALFTTMDHALRKAIAASWSKQVSDSTAAGAHAYLPSSACPWLLLL